MPEKKVTLADKRKWIRSHCDCVPCRFRKGCDFEHCVVREAVLDDLRIADRVRRGRVKTWKKYGLEKG